MREDQNHKPLTAEAAARSAAVDLTLRAYSNQRGEIPPVVSSLPPTDHDETTDRTSLRPLSVSRLVGWLEHTDLNRIPSDNERRKLSAAIRRIAPPDAADAVLDALWWRVHAPLRLWRAAFISLRESPPGACNRSLIGWARHLLKQLSTPPPRPEQKRPASADVPEVDSVISFSATHDAVAIAQKHLGEGWREDLPLSRGLR